MSFTSVSEKGTEVKFFTGGRVFENKRRFGFLERYFLVTGADLRHLSPDEEERIFTKEFSENRGQYCDNCPVYYT